MKIDGDKLLLTEKARCPRCFQQRVDWLTRRCSNCHTLLLKSYDSFNRITDEGIRDFYVFFETGKMRGWTHSDHLLNTEKPNLLSAPEVKAPEPNDRPLPEGCSAGPTIIEE